MPGLFFFIIVFVVEFALAIFMLFLVIVGKVFSKVQEKKQGREEEKLRRLLFLLMTKQKSLGGIDWDELNFSKEVLLRVLENFHANFNDQHWKKIETFLAETFLLPWARKSLRKKRWIYRNRVARIFLLHTEERDLKNIEHLLEDKNFYIRMLAVEALGQLRSPAIVRPLLKKMAKEPVGCRFIYRYVLLAIPSEFIDKLLNLYKEAQEEALRLCCLDVLSYRFFGDVHTLVRRDLFSQNNEIRLLVTKILGNIGSEPVLADLLSMLEDPDPRIREEALRALGEMHSEKSFAKLIHMLHDPAYEVRLQAAQSIFKFGKKGREVLEQQDWDIDPLAFEVARYVLTSL